ncbi:3'(2'),5'-bisphosphate nucleotidase [Hydrogenivirga caldilitoris]|uniref:3'(2'),5'-bisphosphate nucleotidase CysQ n=1 Tax=Hydrogenivirga caldilitoris TaxID=246264 RepID=A0A497XQA5_9AQUI|nr:3'(2'),5'-bisphosphate nucleotidase CysQ [Hydrogenivirga caldilitoris]RLJ70434.1 3'(2'),5'-bisphosphate nucleotidase [Hydrogenivirga caldilitoris]
MILDVINIALKAGEEILKVYEGNMSVDYKEDRTPLTEADRRSHRVIVKSLKSLTPEIPILSEEGKDIPYEERKGWREFWLVDPLDGTKEFIKKNGEFTVNIALVENREPVAGVVYAPAKNLLFFARKGEGAYKIKVNCSSLDEISIERAERLPLYRNNSFQKPLRVIASRSHMNEETKAFIEKLKSKVGEIELLSAGSSLKFCLVAEGKAEIYPRLGPTMEWDTAAAHIIATESGCEVRTLNGEPLTYNKEDLRNPYFIVVRKETVYIPA